MSKYDPAAADVNADARTVRFDTETYQLQPGEHRHFFVVYFEERAVGTIAYFKDRAWISAGDHAVPYDVLACVAQSFYPYLQR